jgi:hypothetical protein
MAMGMREELDWGGRLCTRGCMLLGAALLSRPVVVDPGTDPTGDELQPPSPPAPPPPSPPCPLPHLHGGGTGGGADEDEMSSATPLVSVDAPLLPPLLRATVVRSPCLLIASSTDTL